MYDITKSDLTRIADVFIKLEEESGDESESNQSIINTVNFAQSELEDICPETWWMKRDEEFDTLRRKIKSVENTNRRKNMVHEFHMHVIELIYNELNIEP